MKLASFVGADGVRLGVQTHDLKGVLDLDLAHRLVLGATLPAFSSMLALIQDGGPALVAARALLDDCVTASWAADAVVPIGQIEFAPPLAPPRMLCFSVYETHLRQSFEAAVTLRAGKVVGGAVKRLGLVRPPKGFYRKPVYYKGNNLSVSAHDSDVLWPRWTRMLDYEMELGVVIGKSGKNIRADDAMPYVFGYTCFNDFSARDVMMQEIPWGGVGPIKGKDFDTGNAIGPWLVTADEVPDPYDLDIQVRVNGEVRGKARTSEMLHPIQRMIEVASDEEMIVPGEFFGTGAASNGCGIEQLRFLEPNDIVEIEIERIGVLRNRVVKPS